MNCKISFVNYLTTLYLIRHFSFLRHEKFTLKAGEIGRVNPPKFEKYEDLLKQRNFLVNFSA